MAAKKIGLLDCDDDLKLKLESLMRLYNGEVAGVISNTALQDLTKSINQDIDNLKTGKADKVILANYFQKSNDKLSKDMLDADLAEVIEKIRDDRYRLLSDKISYSDLNQDTIDKIEGIENRLINLNKLILTSGTGNTSGSGNNDIIQGALADINATIVANKESSDTGIANNKDSINSLSERVEANEDTLRNLDNLYERKGKQIELKNLPEDVQDVTKKFKDAAVFTQDEKNLIMQMSTATDDGMSLEYGYVASDKTTLEIYCDNLYTPIYYSMSAESGNDYTIRYDKVETAVEGVIGTGNIDFKDSTIVNSIPSVPNSYSITVLSKDEKLTYDTSLIYGDKNKTLIYKNTVIAQRKRVFINEETTLDRDASKEYDTSRQVDSLFLADVDVYIKNNNEEYTDASPFVTIAKSDNKFNIINESDEQLTLKIVAAGNLF